MHRIPASLQALESASPALPPEALRHLRVLRPRKGETVELFDGAGHVREFRAGADGSLAAAGKLRSFPPPAAPLVLFACITKGERWDWTIQKAVELGATRIVPVMSARSVVKIARGEEESKMLRWRKVAEEAARQSGAVWTPSVEAPASFAAALEEARALKAAGGRVFAGVLSEPPPPPLAAAAAGYSGAAGMFVGPEGDFSPDELDALKGVAEAVSFGSSVLRAETASMFALAVLGALRDAVR